MFGLYINGAVRYFFIFFIFNIRFFYTPDTGNLTEPNGPTDGRMDGRNIVVNLVLVHLIRLTMAQNRATYSVVCL